MIFSNTLSLDNVSLESKLDAVVSDLNVNNIEEANTYLSRFGVSADSVEIWGTGTPRREFLWSEDMADACVFLMQNRNFSRRG